jgi:hypothetical protein
MLHWPTEAQTDSDSLAGVGVAIAAAHWLVILVSTALQLAGAQQTAEALINMSSCRTATAAAAAERGSESMMANHWHSTSII